MASKQRPTNVEIVAEMYDAFNARDTQRVLGRMAADVKWTEPAGSPFGGTFNGPEAVLHGVFRPARKLYDPFEVAPGRFVDAGDTVVVEGEFHGTTQDGREIVSPFAHVWEVENGEIVRMQNYTDTALMA
jgi:ketosteroid isomerase-like protein